MNLLRPKLTVSNHFDTFVCVCVCVCVCVGGGSVGLKSGYFQPKIQYFTHFCLKSADNRLKYPNNLQNDIVSCISKHFDTFPPVSQFCGGLMRQKSVNLSKISTIIYLFCLRLANNRSKYRNILQNDIVSSIPKHFNLFHTFAGV